MTTAAPRELFLTIRRAESKVDFETVRRIRNAARVWLHDSHEITVEEQESFRCSFIYPVWIYRTGHTTVGWGLVRLNREGYAVVSLAVAPEQRGHGYGTAMFRDLRARWTPMTPDRHVWAYVRYDNTASLRAALGAGYELTTRILTWGVVALKAEVTPAGQGRGHSVTHMVTAE